MNFLFRSIRPDDLDKVVDLARQFSLLNLPANRRVIEEKIDESVRSFQGELPKKDATFVFVLEDTHTNFIAGSSQIIAKHGTPEHPAYSFKILKKERFSKDLGVGFIHQILRLRISEDGPSEIGGLVVDRAYRSRPEKVGRICSLGRFLYMGLRPDQFEEYVYAQMVPPLTEEGRSEFWEALGRRFTGMPYQEADVLSQQNQEFIRSLFPEEDIYLALLDPKARLVMGRVGQETQPALHMLENIGFTMMHEVDPFDGGPHIHCRLKDISLIRKGKQLKVEVSSEKNEFKDTALIGVIRDHEFLGGASAYQVVGDSIYLPEKTRQVMDLAPGEMLYVTPMDGVTKGGRR
jgi:arginine N-succinyltransferase